MLAWVDHTKSEIFFCLLTFAGIFTI